MAIQRPRFLAPASAAGQGNSAIISALALQILMNPRVQLARAHVSQVADRATATHNAVHSMFEHMARRSGYQNAPGARWPSMCA